MEENKRVLIDPTRGRGISSLVVASSLIAGMMSEETQMAMQMLMPRIKHKRRPLWKCKKCGDEFYPHYSNSMCDTCIKRMDGEL